ncbi:MAG: preprotein translocase subunit YajC [Ghiorsea sp.]
MNHLGLRKHISGIVSVMALAFLPASTAFAEGGGASDGFASLIPLVLIMVIFWVLLIRPQQKRMKEHAAVIKELKKGDKIVTGGGFLGQITDVKDNFLVVELAEGVRVKVKQDTILDLQNKD